MGGAKALPIGSLKSWRVNSDPQFWVKSVHLSSSGLQFYEKLLAGSKCELIPDLIKEGGDVYVTPEN